MKTGKVLLFALLAAGFITPLNAQQPTEGWSNRGGWKYEVRENNDGEKDIWIIPESNPAAAKIMTSTGGWGNLRVHVSPDDKIIIVEDGGGSLGIHLRIFVAGAGIAEFVEDENFPLSDTVEAWALAKAGAPAGTFLGHRYIRVR